MFRPFSQPVARCWEVLRRGGRCWLKFENGQIFHATFANVTRCCGRLARFVQQCCIWACALLRLSIPSMSQHVARGWPNARNMLRTKNVAICLLKCCHRLAGACKCWANNLATCCADMLRTFGPGFSHLYLMRHWPFTRLCRLELFYVLGCLS